MMQNNIVETAMGAFVLIVAVVFVFFFQNKADVAVPEGYALTAAFSKVDGLQNGSLVTVGGVKVGKVTDITLDTATYQAVVHMTVDANVKLPKDTAAVMGSAGLLDGKFLSLQPGGDEEMLADGDKIEYTQSTPSLEQLLGQVIFSLTKNDDKSKEG